MSSVPPPSPKPSLRAILASAVFAIVAWQLVGCGGAEPRASVSGGEAPATVEGAEAELARLEASLDRTFGNVTGDGAAEPALPAPPIAGMPEPGPMSKKGEAASRCENACDALASMGRSADRICQLAGPGDRCEAAKTRVASASTRVTAQCSECEP